MSFESGTELLRDTEFTHWHLCSLSKIWNSQEYENLNNFWVFFFGLVRLLTGNFPNHQAEGQKNNYQQIKQAGLQYSEIQQEKRGKGINMSHKASGCAISWKAQMPCVVPGVSSAWNPIFSKLKGRENASHWKTGA